MRRGLQENLTITLLLVGGFLWGVGWLVGVVLLWLSDAWTAREKLVGTLFVPGGLALPSLLVIFALVNGSSTGCLTIDGVSHCTTSGGRPLWERGLLIALLVALVAASIGAAVFLAKRARSPRLLATNV